MPSLARALERATRALDEHDERALLRHLLAAWRVSRAEEIAELVDAVSARLDVTLPRIDGETRSQIQSTWLAIARVQDPADLPRLLDAITHTKHRSTDALERVRALAGWPHDPRTGGGVIRQLQRPVFYTSTTKPFWSALVALAVEHGDPRTATVLAELATDYHRVLAAHGIEHTPQAKWFRRMFEQALATLARLPPPHALTAHERELCTQLAARLRDSARGTRDLMREIVVHPDDDHLRHVIADQLQERNDPRGELIALQLADRDPERQRALLAQFRHVWLGPLAHVVDREACRFERGFLHEVRLRIPHGEDSRLVPLVGDPIWATVRRLHLGYMRALPIALLHAPVMRLDHLGGLRGVEPGDPLYELLASPVVPYASLQASTGVRGAVAALEAIVAARGALGRLRALVLDENLTPPADVIARIHASWLAEQLVHVGIAGGLERLPQWLAALREHPLALDSFSLTFWGKLLGRLVLTRDDDGAFTIATLSIEHAIDVRDRQWLLAYRDVLPALEDVAPGLLRQVTVVGRPPRSSERSALARVCKRIGAKLVLP